MQVPFGTQVEDSYLVSSAHGSFSNAAEMSTACYISMLAANGAKHLE